MRGIRSTPEAGAEPSSAVTVPLTGDVGGTVVFREDELRKGEGDNEDRDVCVPVEGDERVRDVSLAIDGGVAGDLLSTCVSGVLNKTMAEN